mmetsp:Transcript_44166/g.111286  ORF Transcript_44166/g.111286 Transcript_44166/m.111286 type:complete len:224 (-) Transcript_44166:988-1659(-)
MLIKGNQSAERTRSHQINKDRVTGSVAREHLMGKQGLKFGTTQALSTEFCTSFLGGLPLHQCFGLRKGVRHQNGVMIERERIVCAQRHNKVARDQFAALMDQLVEGMLPVGARLTPDHRTCAVAELGDGAALSVHTLSVALHVHLLEVGSEAVQVLIVGQDGVCLCVTKVVVPHTEQTQQHGGVLQGRGATEVAIHLVCTSQQLLKVIHTHSEGNTHADGRPQ